MRVTVVDPLFFSFSIVISSPLLSTFWPRYRLTGLTPTLQGPPDGTLHPWLVAMPTPSGRHIYAVRWLSVNTKVASDTPGSSIVAPNGLKIAFFPPPSGLDANSPGSSPNTNAYDHVNQVDERRIAGGSGRRRCGPRCVMVFSLMVQLD